MPAEWSGCVVAIFVVVTVVVVFAVVAVVAVVFAVVSVVSVVAVVAVVTVCPLPDACVQVPRPEAPHGGRTRPGGQGPRARQEQPQVKIKINVWKLKFYSRTHIASKTVPLALPQAMPAQLPNKVLPV